MPDQLMTMCVYSIQWTPIRACFYSSLSLLSLRFVQIKVANTFGCGAIVGSCRCAFRSVSFPFLLVVVIVATNARWKLWWQRQRMHFKVWKQIEMHRKKQAAENFSNAGIIALLMPFHRRHTHKIVLCAVEEMKREKKNRNEMTTRFSTLHCQHHQISHETKKNSNFAPQKTDAFLARRSNFLCVLFFYFECIVVCTFLPFISFHFSSVRIEKKGIFSFVCLFVSWVFVCLFSIFVWNLSQKNIYLFICVFDAFFGIKFIDSLCRLYFSKDTNSIHWRRTCKAYY